MPTIAYLKPLDQPTGVGRVLSWISAALRVRRFSIFRLVIAFAKEGPLLRIAPHIHYFRAHGGNVQAIFGVDHMGTSVQALTLALNQFDRSFVWHHPSPFTTFHPKIYAFEGNESAEIYIGSNNLTVGGLETNCESAVRVSFAFPDEAAEWAQAFECWTQLMRHPNTMQLTSAVLSQLRADGLLLDEAQGTQPGVRSALRPSRRGGPSQFPFTSFQPPSSRPRAVEAPVVSRARPGRRPVAGREIAQMVAASARSASGLPDGLVIQIVPHHNGEIFLSKLAINQNPRFFGFPFTGQTVPKRLGNPPYPQRIPDPLTEWRIYNRRGAVLRTLFNFRLNTVFYERKGEIRITVSPEVARLIPARSIMLMAIPGQPSSLDYVCDVFPPSSPQYAALLRSCNQEMPSGGGTPRRFGWL